jgi:hypothetical protein
VFRKFEILGNALLLIVGKLGEGVLHNAAHRISNGVLQSVLSLLKMTLK